MSKLLPDPAPLQTTPPAGTARAAPHYILRLYIAGSAQHSVRAISNIRKLCETYLPGRYHLDVIDIAQHPELAIAAQVIAAPTLSKLSPKPIRHFIGDMSRTEKILTGLDIHLAVPQHAAAAG